MSAEVSGGLAADGRTVWGGNGRSPVYIDVGLSAVIRRPAAGVVPGTEHAARVRDRLHQASVPAVRLVGPPGGGKTTVVEETLWQLRDRLRIAVVVANPAASRDAGRLARYCDQVESIDTAAPDPADVAQAVARLDLYAVDLVLVEACGGLVADLPDVGQDETVAVLSVSGGDDKAAEYAGLVRAASVLLLTKIDLRQRVSFDAAAFRADVQRINPAARVMELAAYENVGMGPWLGWLEGRQRDKQARRPGFAELTPECFFG